MITLCYERVIFIMEQTLNPDRTENILRTVYGQLCAEYNKKKPNVKQSACVLDAFKKKYENFKSIDSELTEKLFLQIKENALIKWGKLPDLGWEPALTSSKLNTEPWKKAKFKAYLVNGNFCACCGATPSETVRLTVDHIKPRSKYPHLKYDVRNLQVLCEDCNIAKGNWTEVDFRNPDQKLRAMTVYHFPETLKEF